MLRAVNEGFVKLKIEVDVDAAYDTIDDLISKIKIKLRHIYNLLLKIVSRLLNPAISNETLQEAKSKRMQSIRFCY
jgi:uncharacterized protein